MNWGSFVIGVLACLLLGGGMLWIKDRWFKSSEAKRLDDLSDALEAYSENTRLENSDKEQELASLAAEERQSRAHERSKKDVSADFINKHVRIRKPGSYDN